ncbi:MAG: hypothetical protein IKC65_07900 [Lentisphaeria bacterium]|nr:hypothetical protein [Lentisphaeria bacterium]
MTSQTNSGLHFQALLNESERPEWRQWRDILRHCALLHEISLQPAMPPALYEVETLGAGYCFGSAFGHWDLIYSLLDSCPVMPEHTRKQLLNQFAFVRPDGFMGGVIGRSYDLVITIPGEGFPPIWPAAVDCYYETTADAELLEKCLQVAINQISWFENNRRADKGGFFYCDVLNGRWESGVDQSIRVEKVTEKGKFTCVDATSHVRLLCDAARRWTRLLNKEGAEIYDEKCAELDQFIQEKCFFPETGFFHDPYLVERGFKYRSLNGCWPLFCEAATQEQAASVHKHLMTPGRFLDKHPLPYIAMDEEVYELRMWRGPAWNSITLMVLLGLERYGQYSSAARLAEMALNDTALQHLRTGALWEFYDPASGHQHKVFRKEGPFRVPCREYLGHNPLFALARLWSRCRLKNNG